MESPIESAEPSRLVRPAPGRHGSGPIPQSFFSWLIERAATRTYKVERVPLSGLSRWSFAPGTGNLVHSSGGFFSIEGLCVEANHAGPTEWVQPIIVQPEIGILGILVKKIDGVLHCLMHAKMEPGNVNYVQLSPTVQATRSNYTRVHGGAPVPYLEYFRASGTHRVLVDVLQSEQGSWFLHKRNRNMVVETTDDVPLKEDYFWLTLDHLRVLLQWDNIVNMDTRTVLSCFPAFGEGGGFSGSSRAERAPFARAVLESFQASDSGWHILGDVLSWITAQRAGRALVQRRVPLSEVARGGWYQTENEIAHESGGYFQVIGIGVSTTGREVATWQQPLLAPREPGILAFISRRIEGLLHVLVQARVEAGSPNGIEMAPTVHCQPINYRDVPPHRRPRYLDVVLGACPSQIRYDVMLSEEGGRFYHARNRYMVVEVDDRFPIKVPDDFLWVTLGQLSKLLSLSHYANVELRSLVACARTLC